MRTAPTLALTLLLLAACKGDDGDTSTTSPEMCSEGYGDGPDVDPNFPACGCLPDRCVGAAECVPSGFPDWTSSVCLPPCKIDGDCPTLSGLSTMCSGAGFCHLPCSLGDTTCPKGYVCGEGGECQVDLTGG